jgi:hypothetical protein
MPIQGTLSKKSFYFQPTNSIFMKLTLTLLVQLLFFSLSYSQKIIKPVNQTTYKNDSIYSQYLQRTVSLINYYSYATSAKIIFAFGQRWARFPALGMQASVESMLENKHTIPFLTVGIHCNHERILEYGTAAQADYKNRGTKAGLYTLFILNELIPYLEHQYPLKENLKPGYSQDFRWEVYQLLILSGIMPVYSLK